MTSSPITSDHDVVARAEDKMAAEMGDETVILDVVSGFYFQLNKSAARIWDMLEEPLSIADLSRRIEVMFDVDAATCHAEVLGFLEVMRVKGLVELRGSADAD